MFYFHEFLERIDVDPTKTKLLRHNPSDFTYWIGRELEKFGCYASFQKKSPSPYAKSTLACHFLPGPNTLDGKPTAIYLGTTKVLDKWDWDGKRMPRIYHEELIKRQLAKSFEGLEAFDLEWFNAGSEYAERIVIDWGSGTRAWFQWADRKEKELLEIRSSKHEIAFPGFSRFIGQISNLPSWPKSWLDILSNVTGIYLLVAENGDQYVGSATGENGLIGRWNSYFVNGHGGNVLLKERSHKDYQVSILEVLSNEMSLAEVIDRENFWKKKLGTRAYGLNAN